MEEHTFVGTNAGGRFVRLADGDMYVVEDGQPGARALLLIHGSAGSLASMEPVVPWLAGPFRVIVSTCSAADDRHPPPVDTTSLVRLAGLVPLWTG